MARFRGGRARGGGRGGRNRGNRGASRGASRGGTQDSGRLARSGIKTKSGYRKFDSQRLRDVDDSDSENGPRDASEEELESAVQDSSENDGDEELSRPTKKSYNALLQSFRQSTESTDRRVKRRKLEDVTEPEKFRSSDDEFDTARPDAIAEDDNVDDEVDEVDAEAEDQTDDGDPFEVHFANPDDNELSRRLKAVQTGDWRTERQSASKAINLNVFVPACTPSNILRKPIGGSVTDLPLKERLLRNVESHVKFDSDLERILTSYVFNYTDLFVGNRTPQNVPGLRKLACLHALNHILKGRDKVLKNNERLSHADEGQDLQFSDQGFVRPKVLILTETRQMAARYADDIVHFFQPDQQENKKRFTDSFTDPIEERDTMPEDFSELFDGNNDNSFLTAIKFTRRNMKFYSAFYSSDIILASPVGLRRVIEDEDVNKRDYDFLSSIEIVIVDQADAMQMQSWENVEIVLKHLNLQLTESHGCDFSRVRKWYLDDQARYMRQTIVFSAYITPEMNRLFNSSMLNVAGKVKLTPTYAGAIAETSGLGIKQTFSRFDSPSPLGDPDARFKYFTNAILPRLLRLPRPSNGAQGILIFIPSYFDFLRLRNFFATSTQTENVSFGTIHDYSEVPEQRRARSHFLSGRHSILLYTQRAHHFFRLKIRGVKRVVMYGLPDNPIFYQEMVEGFLETSVNEGLVEAAHGNVRCAFSKWDGLRLERVVGSQRVKGMLGGVGDTFDFL